MKLHVSVAPPGHVAPSGAIRRAKTTILDALARGKQVNITTLEGLVAVIELYEYGLVQLVIEPEGESVEQA